jgi:hypothetical protein
VKNTKFQFCMWVSFRHLRDSLVAIAVNNGIVHLTLADKSSQMFLPQKNSKVCEL